MNDHTLATTFTPQACLPCHKGGLSVEQCAALHSAELHGDIALANHDIATASTAAEVVPFARAKAEASRRLTELRNTPRKSRVAIIGPDGFPFAILDRTSRTFRQANVVPTDSPNVFQLV